LEAVTRREFIKTRLAVRILLSPCDYIPRQNPKKNPKFGSCNTEKNQNHYELAIMLSMGLSFNVWIWTLLLISVTCQ